MQGAVNCLLPGADKWTDGKVHTTCPTASIQLGNCQHRKLHRHRTCVMAAVKAMYASEVAATMAPTSGRNMRDSTDTTATISSDVGTSRNTMARHIAEMLLVPAEWHSRLAAHDRPLSCVLKAVQHGVQGGDLQKAA
jgi:hypothetical protein